MGGKRDINVLLVQTATHISWRQYYYLYRNVYLYKKKIYNLKQGNNFIELVTTKKMKKKMSYIKSKSKYFNVCKIGEFR